MRIRRGATQEVARPGADSEEQVTVPVGSPGREQTIHSAADVDIMSTTLGG